MALTRLEKRTKIKRRVRKTISGTGDLPRLSVFRSNKQISAQVINDVDGKTLISASSLDKDIAGKKVNKIEQAALLGKLIAEKAKEAGIETIVFDRNGYIYHGRIKSMADAAREGGLKF